MKKILSVIDCYIHNEDTIDKLDLFLNSLLTTNRDILLISNTPIPERIQRKVKFSFYDSNNKLFDENFDYVNDCWSNHWLNDFTIHEHFFSKQYHGLSVLNNLTNSLSLVKSLGYTHFEKFEWDFKLGDNTIKNIESLKRICFLNQKKSIFIVNYNTDKPEFRFDYFMSEINFFEEHFNKINNQEDYKNFIFNHYGNNNFINVEQFLYKCFDGLSNDILLIDNEEIFTLFGNSDINTKISLNYIPKYFNYCTTRLYKINDEKLYVVLTYNYGSEPHNRTIEIVYSDGSTELLHHTVSSPHSFTYNNINENVIKIIVYNNNTPIFEETVENIKNKITFY